MRKGCKSQLGVSPAGSQYMKNKSLRKSRCVRVNEESKMNVVTLARRIQDAHVGRHGGRFQGVRKMVFLSQRQR